MTDKPLDKVSPKKEIGKRIRFLRKKQGLTQEEMAEKCRLHWTYIGGLERGERNPTLTTLQRVSDGLGTTLFDLLNADFFKDNPNTEVDAGKEGRLWRLIRKKDGETLDLAAGIVKEVISWREKYGPKT